MYCQKCGMEMKVSGICSMCGNEQKIFTEEELERMERRERAMKAMRKTAEIGGSITEKVLKNVLDTSIRTTGVKVQEKVNKKAVQMTHKGLVKMKLEKKTLGDRICEIRKRRR